MFRKPHLFVLASAFVLSACAGKSFRANEKLTDDFFAVVTEVVEINNESDTIKGVVGGALEGAKPTRYDTNIERRGIIAAVYAVVGGVIGLSRDLEKVYYRYEYVLDDTDSEHTHVFYSDSSLAYGDCVYVDAGKKPGGRKYVTVKKIASQICQNDEL